jgi:hypothetical protein
VSKGEPKISTKSGALREAKFSLAQAGVKGVKRPYVLGRIKK